MRETLLAGGDRDRAPVRRSRHRVPGPGIPRRPVRDDRPRRGGNGPLRRGAGGAVRRRADRAGHGGRDLLRAPLGMRAGQRRPARRPVDARRRRAHAAEQRRRRLLPRPLRRHPDGCRTLAGGGGRAARGGAALRPGDVGAARRRGHPPRRTCASDRAASRRPPCCSRDSSSIRTSSPRWPRSTWPAATRRLRGICWSGPPKVRTTRFQRSARRP